MGSCRSKKYDRCLTLASVYYSPQGYWKGFAAVKKLADESGVSTEVASDWLKKQAIWQIYLPAPKHIPRPIFDVTVETKSTKLIFYF